LGHRAYYDQDKYKLCITKQTGILYEPNVGQEPCVIFPYKISINKLVEDDYYGFEIDGNRRFVLGDFTVTHNTVMALKIISLLKKKTLIIVHKEFLMNQWIERIQEFLPGAKIGKIQAQVFDIEGKDIVLGMLQTLYDKDYPNHPFSQFGLTIVDEVHRIGSEQFSKTLLKTITPYMLGISATVDRKDKLTKVLYMFMGEKIYSETREQDDAVTVRAIEYISQDERFNEVVYDFRGNAQYSTMITKLCEFGRRSDFIVRVLGDLLLEHSTLDIETECQIMVLCHNRSLLTYLHSAIQHRLPQTTVGFYVGGMKQKNLQETERKQIVLATYAMAAEALDIKSLSILVMATPKTDIIQSVGRILRVRHDNPIVVDIVDRHDLFQNQWKKRRAYFKKSNYRIMMTDSDLYDGMIGTRHKPNIWKTIYEPKALVSDEEDEDEKPISGNHSGKLLCEGKCLVALE
jgi:superfamily II DNA or RNA helicase